MYLLCHPFFAIIRRMSKGKKLDELSFGQHQGFSSWVSWLLARKSVLRDEVSLVFMLILWSNFHILFDSWLCPMIHPITGRKIESLSQYKLSSLYNLPRSQTHATWSTQGNQITNLSVSRWSVLPPEHPLMLWWSVTTAILLYILGCMMLNHPQRPSELASGTSYGSALNAQIPEKAPIKSYGRSNDL